MADEREKFYKAMSDYYKNERDRTEITLDMISSIAGGGGPPEPLFEAILTVLIRHYSRAAS